MLLDDVTFHAPCESLTAIMGPSGAGKTILLDCLMNQVSPNGMQGRITWYDQLRFSEAAGQQRVDGRNNVRFGYVPATRDFTGCFTVRETLEQACTLKLGHVDATRVTDILNKLHLRSCEHVRVR